MIKGKPSKFLQSTRSFFQKNSSSILVGMGLTGLVVTPVLSALCTPKFINRIDDKKEEMQVDKLGIWDIIKIGARVYLVPAGLCIVSGACIIGSVKINSKKNAALMAMYNMSEAALLGYKDKVVEVIGENKAKEINEKVIKSEIDTRELNEDFVIKTNGGSTLCYDAYSGRFFRSSQNALEDAINKINRSIIAQDYANLSEYYDLIGLSNTLYSDFLGWNVNMNMVEKDFMSGVHSSGEPYIVLQFKEHPIHNYDQIFNNYGESYSPRYSKIIKD